MTKKADQTEPMFLQYEMLKSDAQSYLYTILHVQNLTMDLVKSPSHLPIRFTGSLSIPGRQEDLGMMLCINFSAADVGQQLKTYS